MKSLPRLTDDAVIDLAREGGFAYIPKLSGARRITLSQLPAPQKERVCDILRQAFPFGEAPGAQSQAGHGDCFYYRIQISYATTHQTGDIVLLIPENRASPELKALWQRGE
ncbi:hypothetical protein ED28_05485 [[Pantoea] beijingensis]|uniref:Uncharacterized protein n=1 Tax=[Pantoea] beijingensis TaxID=1324864 RepID=A0A443IFY9_9GAMM|nr:protealysin inhibitor emfourin [[Pantoea] beijingensis]RWR02997.1 hypothetical protein ED28_05485 [[Pantoea] beijingensis]